MTIETKDTVRWRATGPYLTIFTSKAGLFGETRHFLQTYGQTGNLANTRQLLIDGGLPQRSRVTRVKIMEMIIVRLVRWHPPAWVLSDLVDFANDEQNGSLQAALILHVARQDTLLYDIIQQVIVPRWKKGDLSFGTSAAQSFLNEKQSSHPEIEKWSASTRERLSQHLLSTLRDYGLVTGKLTKKIVEPVVPEAVVRHLIRLLQEEGIPDAELAQHPDWKLWLWEEGRAQAAIKSLAMSNTYHE